MRSLRYITLTWLTAMVLQPGVARSEESLAPESMRRIHREWIEIGHGIRFGIGATVVTLSHREPRVTYVGTEVGYIYRSLDGGVTWDETRLLPDDVPLLNVPLMNLNSLPFPNDGLRDSFRAPLDPWMFDTLFGSHSRTYARPETYGMTGYETGTTRYTFPSVLAHSSTYAGGGGGARVETEDPGNLMALYFSGIAAQAGRVNWLEICATDPSVAFAATNFGAFRTRDMGITWDRVFIGSSTEENSVRSVHCHPENANNVYLATAQGMRISRDGGDQWERPTGNLGAWGTNFITTHPLDRQKLLVGTDIGSYATISGAEEETLYFADQPAPEVRSVTVVRGTSDPNTMYVGTRDGAAYTHNGGETWTRMGEFLLGHYPIYALEVDPRDPQHLYVQTPYHLFESYDGGASLEEILTGYTDLRFSLLDPLDPDVLWVVGYSQVWRYQRPEPTPSGPPSEAARRAREALSVDPGLDETMERALARAHLDQRHVQEHRQNIRRSSLVPTADLAGWIGFNFGRMSSTTTNINLSHYSYFFDLGCNMYEMATAYCGYRGGSFAINPQDSFDLNYFGVFLVLAWPLGRAVLDERATGRMWLDILRMRDRVMYMVYDYWSDRHRMLNYLARGGNDLLAEQAYVMRLEEMSAVLDGMTDGFLGGPFGESRRR